MFNLITNSEGGVLVWSYLVRKVKLFLKAGHLVQKPRVVHLKSPVFDKEMVVGKAQLLNMTSRVAPVFFLSAAAVQRQRERKGE